MNQIPLSFGQLRLWLLDQIDGPSPAYNIARTFNIHGPLDVAALDAAIADVVRRHESLRTVFALHEGEAIQQVLPDTAGASVLEVRDINEAELAQAVAEASSYCFDLGRDLPLRASLFRRSEQEHVLVLLLHHIAGDGWSLGPLLRDLALAYEARSRGQEPAWVPLPVQYADYTIWQKEVLGDEADPTSPIAAQLGYWRNALAGLPEQLDLPYDRPRPVTPNHRGERVNIQFDAALHTKLMALAKEGKASLFMVLQAGLSALLTRLGAGTDIPLGSPIAGRTDVALDNLVGFFVNTLVLRTDTSGNPSFHDLLARVREQDLAAYSNQDLPFERLVEVLNPPRSFSRHPLFQVMLVLQNNAQSRFDLPGLSLTRFKGEGTQTAKFDLSFSFSEARDAEGQPKGLSGRIEYATDLFDRQTVEAIAARLERIFQAVVADPA
nr:condensation domain-containing protein [Agrobacterium sp. rho-8.1]